MLDYPFVNSDGGCRFSSRPRQKNDCTVIAIVHATMYPYDYVYDLLAELGRKSHERFELGIVAQINPIPEFRLKWRDIPRKTMNIADFCRLFKYGVFIVSIEGHAFTVRDGVAYDTKRQKPEAEVIGYYEVTTEHDND